jgi:hypothetical protein
MSAAPVAPSTPEQQQPYQGGQRQEFTPSPEMPRCLPKHKVFTVGDGICVKPSLIQGAGRGAFVTRDVAAAGDLYTEYGGELIDRNEACNRVRQKKDTHLRSIHPAHSAIDGIGVKDEKGAGAASFMNDPRDSSKYNCEWFKTDVVQPLGVQRSGLDDVTRQYARNTKPLKAGDELYISYGTSYWNRHANQLVSAPSTVDTKHTPTPTESAAAVAVSPLKPQFVPPIPPFALQLVSAVCGECSNHSAAGTSNCPNHDKRVSALQAYSNLHSALNTLSSTYSVAMDDS